MARSREEPQHLGIMKRGQGLDKVLSTYGITVFGAKDRNFTHTCNRFILIKPCKSDAGLLSTRIITFGKLLEKHVRRLSAAWYTFLIFAPLVCIRRLGREIWPKSPHPPCFCWNGNEFAWSSLFIIIATTRESLSLFVDFFIKFLHRKSLRGMLFVSF